MKVSLLVLALLLCDRLPIAITVVVIGRAEADRGDLWYAWRATVEVSRSNIFIIT